jgi:asparagine synthase (glutamine-hydrolysing)
MCGIVLMIGPGTDRYLFGQMMHAVAARGEVPETLLRDGLLAGTHRLPIVDREHSVQPWCSADGEWLLCYNGEVFNHGQLRAELRARGGRFRTAGDTEVVLEAFRQWGDTAVSRLRGEYAFVAVHRPTGRAYLARDALGVKPLYWSVRDGRLHLASEVKALVPADARVVEVPPGHHGWAEPGAAPQLRPFFHLDRLGTGRPVTDPDEAAAQVRGTLRDSIACRLDTDLTVGVLLSGGLDSSVTLLTVRELHPDCVAFTIGAPGSPDLDHARRLTAELGVPHEVLELRPREIGYDQIREAVRIGELTEYGDIINAVVSVPLFRAVHERGVKVVLTGDGSDELFGGYPMYHAVSPARARKLFLHKLANLGRTELQRVDRASMGSGVEARVPFLDPAVVELALRLPLDLKLRDGQEKWIVRRAFADVLPEYIRTRPKDPMSYSSGLHERARLFKPLFARLHRSFGYDLLEPVRRDFDTVLTRHGNDLDKALAAQTVRTDYTLREHARDLAGAVKWSVKPALRKRSGTPS